MIQAALQKLRDSAKGKNVEIKLECNYCASADLKELLNYIRIAKEAYPCAKVTATLRVE